ncbi:hypothetical protein JRO89_XS01G0348200 [Xanthoceras sorbifolium]|uniref:Cytochrome P450 n=1 Tax=Xanthoceras sorbifolium TaxID=99658 RepID=A0ABQ8IP57_9ROSI|nr:hypothetical protein JRO89_XS01G0348200 [Xanthoceras sorbifolium]
MELYGQVLVALLAIFLISKILQLCRTVLWRPYAVTRSFRKQGIMGPRYSLVSGSLKEMRKLQKDALEMVLDTHSHDITDRIVPHYNRWGDVYVLARNRAKDFHFRPRAGQTRQDWIRHKKIINPAFNIDKLKVITREMATCIISLLKEWENQVCASEDKCKTMEIKGEFKRLSADILARAAFGSSYIEGREAFKAQTQIQDYCVASKSTMFIPGSQYLPTPSNIRIWKLDMIVKNTIRNIIKGRMNAEATGSSDGYGDDILGLMIGASTMVQSRSDLKLKMDEIIDECKSFFFAGNETTAVLLTWTVFLLCVHPEWQSKLREEVLKELGGQIPDVDMLANLKMVNMVLLEALRLYGPSQELTREASRDVKLGNITIPKGTGIIIPSIKIHRSKKYWGEDAEEFNPLRFANGISQAAKNPHALLVFGLGPRACIGQTFAMLKAKMVMALILQRFSFSLSPEYKHTPENMVLLEALRLYDPTMELFREALGDMKLGNIIISKDIGIIIPTMKIHRSKNYWGEDAEEFNPLRLANRISQVAKNPQALLAFRSGPRVCIGQTFTMLEAKMAMALIL